MSVADVPAALLQAALAATLAIALVALLRSPVRRLAGSGVAYALWCLVPLGLIVTFVPIAPPEAARFVAITVHATRDSPVAPQADVDRMPWLALAWLAGALATAGVAAVRQHRFVRALGPLTRRGRVYVASHTVPGLPATLGVLRSRIVVPPAFDAEHSRQERALMLLHERAHLAARDVQAAALAELLRCVLWFHPLVHVATRLFRRDQELACDARVLAAAPRARRRYGETLLKIQLDGQCLPVGCHWGTPHPLKERLTMLTVATPSLRRRRFGAVVVALAALVGAAGATGLAAPPVLDAQGRLDVVTRIDGGEPIRWRGPVDPRQPHHYAWPTDDGHAWTMDLVVTPQSADRYRLSATISRDGRVRGRPTVVVESGVAGGIGLGTQRADGRFEGLQLSITATRGAKVVPL